MSFLVPGRIVWATLTDTQGGNEKRRPAVIVAAPSDIDPLRIAIVAGVTTDMGRARFEETVELPHHAAGHAETKLKKPCEVVCSWVISVPATSLTDSGGCVSSDILASILAKVERFG